MYVFNNHGYKFTQTLLKLLGLWPYKKTKFQRLRAICIYALLISYVLVQVILHFKYVCVYIFFLFFFMYVCMYLYASYFIYIFVQHVSSFFFFKLAQFAIADFNLNVVIRILSDMLPAVIYIVEFNLFFYNTKVVSRKIRFP